MSERRDHDAVERQRAVAAELERVQRALGEMAGTVADAPVLPPPPPPAAPRKRRDELFDVEFEKVRLKNEQLLLSDLQRFRREARVRAAHGLGVHEPLPFSSGRSP